MPVDQRWALNCLRHNRNSGLLGLASLVLLASEYVDALAGKMVVLRGNDVIFDAVPSDRTGTRFELLLDQVVDEYHNQHERYLHTLGEYLRSHRRNLLKESFEVVKAYARETGQQATLQALPCHTFTRLIRNCVSHDLHFHFRKDVLAILPVSYGGVTLDASLQDQPMKEAHLSPFLAWQIHQELAAFVESH